MDKINHVLTELDWIKRKDLSKTGIVTRPFVDSAIFVIEDLRREYNSALDSKNTDKIKTIDDTIDRLHDYLTTYDNEFILDSKDEFLNELLPRAVQLVERVAKKLNKEPSDFNYRVLVEIMPKKLKKKPADFNYKEPEKKLFSIDADKALAEFVYMCLYMGGEQTNNKNALEKGLELETKCKREVHRERSAKH